MEKTTDSTPSPSFEDDYSEGPSDSPSAERRKYHRGGRKHSERESRLPPVPKPAPNDDPREGETLEEYNERIREELSQENQNGGKYKEQDRPPNGEHHEAEGEEQDPEEYLLEQSGTVCDKCKQSTGKKSSPESPFETGIRAFNVKRAQGSGGRPIGVRATSSSKSKKSKKSATKKKKKQKKKAAEEETSSSSEETTDEEDERKPMSIRLDLNLMVEIFLKAKIKGDVTITFL